MNSTKNIIIISLLFLLGVHLEAQISPGNLAQAHAYLEGISNCTKCHEVGNKVTRSKCLSCHLEIKTNISKRIGYHSSPEVSSKNCSDCHNDHHGKNFKIINFDKKKFDHKKTGFELKGVHSKNECNDCHKPEFIEFTTHKNKKGTYLGLKSSCTNCHSDFHQGKLSIQCNTCHSFNSFKEATGFDHSTTLFPLRGKHKQVTCIQCHKTVTKSGKIFQNFDGLVFNNCTGCHKDVHQNKFGQDCKQCHTEESFHFSKKMIAFDHDKTRFKLIGQHRFVDCKQCHKDNYMKPLKFNRCDNCHSDFHKGDFTKNNKKTDCNICHINKGFSPSTFTIKKHNQTRFKLEDAHLATPCSSCHKSDKAWKFSNMGQNCIDCHENIHKGKIREKYTDNNNCKFCHTVKKWSDVNFNHQKTGFKLENVHAKISCSSCHYPRNEKGIKTQIFNGIKNNCSSCHKDNHAGQFAENGETKCEKCHNTNNWHESLFEHNTSRFKLDGAHSQVKCEKCHTPIFNEKGKYIRYKFESIDCAVCHG